MDRETKGALVASMLFGAGLALDPRGLAREMERPRSEPEPEDPERAARVAKVKAAAADRRAQRNQRRLARGGFTLCRATQ